MELSDLGFDRWFREQRGRRDEPEEADRTPARVTAVDRGRYLVRDESGEMGAELTGKLAFDAESGMDFPAVGDWVTVSRHNDGTFAVIHDIYPRRTVLRRKTPGRKVDFQIVAANVDTAFVVQSCDADFNLRRMERYLVMVNEGRIEPVVLLTKTDLVGPEMVEQRIAAIRDANISGRVAALSTVTGEGFDRFRDALQSGKTYCLLGSSGVGKTTLLNHLVGADVFKTAPVREHDGRGRHTTARRQLIVLDGGAMLVDTPGMRELGNFDVEDGIGGTFSDLAGLAADCRFADCTHSGEPGCALLAAVASGEVSEERYRSYLKLAKESEYLGMSYLEKRRKDRKFGRFVTSAMKEMKRVGKK